MASQWFCRVLGQEMGPLSFQDLVEMIRAGTLTENDPVRRKESSEWTPAREVIGLFRKAKSEAGEAATPDSKAATKPAQAAREPAEPQPGSGPISIPRPGRRGWLRMGGAGVLVLVLVAVLTVWAYRSRQSRRFPEPRAGKLIAVEPDALETLRGPPPEVPSVPGLEERVPKLVPGLEEMEPAFSPTLTADLRTIVFSHMVRRGDEGDRNDGYDLYLATRSDGSSPFGEPKRIESTSSRARDAYPTLSPGGRELIFVRSGKFPRFFYTARDSTSSPFGEAAHWTVPGLEATRTQQLHRPQFVGDLSVAFALAHTDSKDRSVWTIERAAPRGEFGAPRQFPVANPWPAYFVMENGLRAYFKSPKGIFVVVRRIKGAPFGPGIPLIDVEVTGPIDGTIWVAPQEDVIFYCSPGPGQEPGSARRLWMIRF